jgi:hypothetical protein
MDYFDTQGREILTNHVACRSGELHTHLLGHRPQLHSLKAQPHRARPQLAVREASAISGTPFRASTKSTTEKRGNGLWFFTVNGLIRI